MEVSLVMTRFPVFIRECANNEKLMMCESKYFLCVFIFVLTADDTTVKTNQDIHGDHIKQLSFRNI